MECSVQDRLEDKGRETLLASLEEKELELDTLRKRHDQSRVQFQFQIHKITEQKQEIDRLREVETQFKEMVYSNKGKEQLFEELKQHHSRFLDQSHTSRPQEDTPNLENSFYISQKKYLIDDEQQYNTELSRLYNKKVLTTLRNPPLCTSSPEGQRTGPGQHGEHGADPELLFQ